MTYDPWLRLRLSSSNSSETHAVLHRFTATDATYSLTVTDLSSIWIDSPSQAEIIRRAEANECVVDVSEPANRRTLICRLSEAFGERDLPATTKLSAVRSGANLTLTASILLSESPQPLEWVFRLTPVNSPDIIREFPLGLLGIADVFRQQTLDLQEIIAEKDFHIRSLKLQLQERLGQAIEYVPRKAVGSVSAFDRNAWLQKWTSQRHQRDGSAPEMFRRMTSEFGRYWGLTGDGLLRIKKGDFMDIGEHPEQLWKAKTTASRSLRQSSIRQPVVAGNQSSDSDAASGLQTKPRRRRRGRRVVSSGDESPDSKPETRPPRKRVNSCSSSDDPPNEPNNILKDKQKTTKSSSSDDDSEGQIRSIIRRRKRTLADSESSEDASQSIRNRSGRRRKRRRAGYEDSSSSESAPVSNRRARVGPPPSVSLLNWQWFFYLFN
ncbi:XRCC4-like factor-domain-containing protein [Myxozyma melibiosi]|uniref:Non-homologous end-joining factor 1 n=1 Tax=Myxozyma melibiosi TaxID=54550 RepID=A0ABR1FAP0_9ASCO